MEVKHFLRAVLDSGILRTWTGNGDFEINEPFKPDGSAPGDEGATYTDGASYLGARGSTASFAMRGGNLINVPVGGRVVDVFSAGFFDDGTWKLLPFVRRGLLDAPTLTGGVYAVSIIPRTWQAPSSRWAQEEHVRQYPEDRFFSQVRALSKGIKGIHFPGVPHFREDGNYDNRYISQPVGSQSGAGSPDSGLDGSPSPSTPGIIIAPGGARGLAAARTDLGGF